MNCCKSGTTFSNGIKVNSIRDALKPGEANVSLKAYSSLFFFPISYLPVTTENVEVKEENATVVDFSLHPTVTVLTSSPTKEALITTSNSLDNAATTTTVNRTTSARQVIQPDDFRHHHFPDMGIFLRKFATEYPNITRLYSVGKSVEQRELYAMEISDNPGIHEAGNFPLYSFVE